MYLGEGSSLTYRGNTVASIGGANTQASVVYTPGLPPTVTANSPVHVSVASAPSIAHIERQPGGHVSLTATGALGVPYTLWAGTNLVSSSWIPIRTGTILNSPFLMEDSGATNHPVRYYRFSTP